MSRGRPAGAGGGRWRRILRGHGKNVAPEARFGQGPDPLRGIPGTAHKEQPR